ncbi:hypothetical protein [Spiroplasma endosymbiont of Nebria brevicollis]|uniref:hypothetical protein n=1 Tax=Spiroplasma endosymbiont of Nebria brevicollis TaxID=3066284 RepID=UPI00313A7624
MTRNKWLGYYSLAVFGNDLYIGTGNNNHTGKFFKFDGTTITLINNWQATNGWINRLYTFGNDLYIGTITGSHKGKLLKVTQFDN